MNINTILELCDEVNKDDDTIDENMAAIMLIGVFEPERATSILIKLQARITECIRSLADTQNLDLDVITDKVSELTLKLSADFQKFKESGKSGQLIHTIAELLEIKNESDN